MKKRDRSHTVFTEKKEIIITSENYMWDVKVLFYDKATKSMGGTIVDNTHLRVRNWRVDVTNKTGKFDIDEVEKMPKYVTGELVLRAFNKAVVQSLNIPYVKGE